MLHNVICKHGWASGEKNRRSWTITWLPTKSSSNELFGQIGKPRQVWLGRLLQVKLMNPQRRFKLPISELDHWISLLSFSRQDATLMIPPTTTPSSPQPRTPGHLHSCHQQSVSSPTWGLRLNPSSPPPAFRLLIWTWRTLAAVALSLKSVFCLNKFYRCQRSGSLLSVCWQLLHPRTGWLMSCSCCLLNFSAYILLPSCLSSFFPVFSSSKVCLCFWTEWMGFVFWFRPFGGCLPFLTATLVLTFAHLWALGFLVIMNHVWSELVSALGSKTT